MATRSARKDLLRKILKDARISAGMRQVDVASKLKVPQSYIAKIEQGERKVTFIEVLDLCRVLGIDAMELVNRLD
jgi:transcriptional regulator with XRE-family HTH domain